MNLCIDQGNTLTKIGLFENQVLIESATIEASDFDAWKFLLSKNEISNIIVSTVQNINPQLKDFLQENSKSFIVFNHNTPIPVKNLYNTPETLGKDRLAAIIGAYSLQPENDILVVDAGTALTFDFINKQAEYLGGTITAGLNMRFQALNTFTKKLPLIDASGETSLLGTTSEEAIRSGVVNGIVYEIEAYIMKLTESYPKLLTFLTGGNCFFFESKLKSTIFANQNLVLIGLNSIINYNAENSKN